MDPNYNIHEWRGRVPRHFERHRFVFDEHSPVDVRPEKAKYSEIQSGGLAKNSVEIGKDMAIGVA